MYIRKEPKTGKTSKHALCLLAVKLTLLQLEFRASVSFQTQDGMQKLYKVSCHQQQPCLLKSQMFSSPSPHSSESKCVQIVLKLEPDLLLLDKAVGEWRPNFMDLFCCGR